jgi:hypothetical protein
MSLNDDFDTQSTKDILNKRKEKEEAIKYWLKPKFDPTGKIFVAVVVKPEGEASLRPDGDWAAFVGNNLKEVTVRAVKASGKWSDANGTIYSVLVGALTSQVVDVKTSFGLEDLDGGTI